MLLGTHFQLNTKQANSENCGSPAAGLKGQTWRRRLRGHKLYKVMHMWYKKYFDGSKLMFVRSYVEIFVVFRWIRIHIIQFIVVKMTI